MTDQTTRHQHQPMEPTDPADRYVPILVAVPSDVHGPFSGPQRDMVNRTVRRVLDLEGLTYVDTLSSHSDPDATAVHGAADVTVWLAIVRVRGDLTAMTRLADGTHDGQVFSLSGGRAGLRCGRTTMADGSGPMICQAPDGHDGRHRFVPVSTYPDPDPTDDPTDPYANPTHAYEHDAAEAADEACPVCGAPSPSERAASPQFDPAAVAAADPAAARFQEGWDVAHTAATGHETWSHPAHGWTCADPTCPGHRRDVAEAIEAADVDRPPLASAADPVPDGFCREGGWSGRLHDPFCRRTDQDCRDAEAARDRDATPAQRLARYAADYEAGWIGLATYRAEEQRFTAAVAADHAVIRQRLLELAAGAPTVADGAGPRGQGTVGFAVTLFALLAVLILAALALSVVADLADTVRTLAP